MAFSRNPCKCLITVFANQGCWKHLKTDEVVESTFLEKCLNCKLQSFKIVLHMSRPWSHNFGLSLALSTSIIAACQRCCFWRLMCCVMFWGEQWIQNELISSRWCHLSAVRCYSIGFGCLSSIILVDTLSWLQTCCSESYMIKFVYRVSNFSPRTRLEKLPSIKDRGQTDGVTNLANSNRMTLFFSPRRAIWSWPTHMQKIEVS